MTAESTSTETLYAVDSGYYFYAGVVVIDGQIKIAAPILKWSIGKAWDDFHAYAQRKRWKIIDVQQKTL